LGPGGGAGFGTAVLHQREPRRRPHNFVSQGRQRVYAGPEKPPNAEAPPNFSGGSIFWGRPTPFFGRAGFGDFRMNCTTESEVRWIQKKRFPPNKCIFSTKVRGPKKPREGLCWGRSILGGGAWGLSNSQFAHGPRILNGGPPKSDFFGDFLSYYFFKKRGLVGIPLPGQKAPRRGKTRAALVI